MGRTKISVIALTLLVATIALVVAACGSEGGDSQALNTDGAPGEEVTQALPRSTTLTRKKAKSTK